MEIKHQFDQHLFFVEVDGFTAYVEYHIENGVLDIVHTIVPDEISRRGIAAALVHATYDYALSQGLKPMGSCSYAHVWLERHPEYLK